MTYRERQAGAKNLRQKEKKLKDLSVQMEDERKQALDYKDQVTTATARTALQKQIQSLCTVCRWRRATSA